MIIDRISKEYYIDVESSLNNTDDNIPEKDHHYSVEIERFLTKC